MTHQAQVVHHVPGRMRVKLRTAKGDSTLLRQIKASIAPMPRVKQVDINPVTGSVLVYYELDGPEDFHNRLAKHARGTDMFALCAPELTKVDRTVADLERETQSEHSPTARSMINLVKFLDEEIKRATDNSLDLKVLLPLGVAIYSLLEFGAEAMPLWVTLGIFSFNSFIALQSPNQGVEEQELIFDRARQARGTQRKMANSKSKKNAKPQID